MVFFINYSQLMVIHLLFDTKEDACFLWFYGHSYKFIQIRQTFQFSGSKSSKDTLFCLQYGL
ncbi:hypothetical protein DWW57_03440 [Odoribacter splanchnicus]|uniref:Uncharacterized protein n=1 Tax=Odoribacter splanchnicus TaxID=28118 RepID=A0A412TWG2_9BACT|nr:hypothetical protein DWW57_03440 [Odoribacter splanchnicus]